FVALTEWQFEPEVSFSIFGERGVIDALGWHPDSGSLLVVELKTEIVDVKELMASMDRRMPLAASVALSRGWRGQTVSCWVAVADGRTNRRALARHAAVLRAKFPDDGRRLAAWLRTPHGTVRALGFRPIADTMSSSGGIAGARRVHHAADRPRV
ncbi:MAG TPA: hypothetical protein VFP22_04800, partial [Candidatus Limnocylindrales bacterium]|nr:hypothetical protein [Candidatus Limnocylindrales bacterium]